MDKNKVIESATKLIAKGSHDKAVKEYQRLLEVDPDDVRVLQKLAELYQKMNRKSDAADCFEKVARTYSAQGFYLKAVALYQQVLKVIDRVEVNIRLAELYQQLGLVGDATKEWQAVAAHYEKIGDTKSSLDTLKKLVDLDPDNVAARIRLGEQYARQDNPVEAVAELRRAAQYLQRNGRQDDYLRVAERISHLDQSDAALAKELAEHFLSRGDSKRALAKLQICFKANPRDLGTLQMLARAFQELGQTSKTVSVLKELARVHADAGRTDDARKAYAQAQELAPDDPELRQAVQALAAEQDAPRRSEPPRPQPAPPRPSPQPVARPPTAPIAPPPPPQAASRPPTAAIMGARPPTSPIQASSAPPTLQQVPKLLKETEVYVKYGLHEKALEHLRRIFSVDPENIDAHEKAKTVALAMGKTEDAISSLATLLRLCVAAGDARADGARAELRKLDPGNAALKGAAKAARHEEELVLDDGEADGEIELETVDGGAGEALAHEELVEEPIEEELVEAEPEEAEAEIEAEPALAEVEPVQAEAGAGEGDDFASDIAEADFYIQAGLVDDARAILEGITLANPDHAGAAERLATLGAPAAAKAGDDLAAELAAELAADASAEENKPLDGDVLDSFQVPAHEVLGEFRAKVQEIVRPEDVQTHYDLGIAYKEMGLLDEAIGEFELAHRHGGGTRAADCVAMLGMCEMERGQAAAAIKRFLEGLALKGLTPAARHALKFELGAAYEAQEQTSEALDQYQSIAEEDPRFRDVADRIQRLGGTVVAAGRPIVKQGSGVTKAAAQVSSAVTAAAKSKPAAAAARSEAELPEPGRKNRKIGFV